MRMEIVTGINPEDPFKRLSAEVSLWSRIKPGNFSRITVAIDGSEREAIRAIVVAAGTLAERLNESHGDVFDPDEAVKHAGELLMKHTKDRVAHGARTSLN